MKDIFEGLYESKGEQEFDRLLNNFRDKWLAIEVKYTRNEPAGKFVSYFDEYKATSMKHKMTKFAQRQGGIDYTYWQNPIEWSNHVAKSEIDANSETRATG